MTRDQSITIASRILAATRDINDPTEQIHAAAKIVRQMMNEYLQIPDTNEAEIARLRKQVVELNTELLLADRGVNRRIYRNIELIKENYDLMRQAVDSITHEI